MSAGPIEITGFRIALSPNDAGIGLATGAMLKFDLGPMHAVVENIGIKSMLKFSPGNLGPVDLDFGFLPPDGIGLSLDAGGFKGGGYLKFDSDRGEYAGALELDFQGLVLGQGHRDHQHEDARRHAGLLDADPDLRGVSSRSS